jgi:two-component system, NarL family, sensor histidine kinase DesK
MTQFSMFARLRGRWYPDDPDFGDMPVLVLGYLLFLITPAFFSNSFQSWTLLSIALYLPLHFMCWRGSNLGIGIICIWLLFAVLLPYNQSSITYLIYACSFAAILPTRLAILSFGLMMLGAVALCWWHGYVAMLVVGVIIGSMTFLANLSFMEGSKRRALLRLSQQEISNLAEKNERERIAREVHDLLGHSLTLIALKAELAGKQLQRDDAQHRAAAAHELQAIAQCAREALSEVRNAVYGMRTPSWSVEIAKSKLACAAAGIALETSDAAIASLPQAIEATFASLLREAINNVVRHSRAARVWIELNVSPEQAHLTIGNDGPRVKAIKEGQGLSSMRERVQSIQGELHWSAPAHGLIVSVRVPLKPPTEALQVRSAALEMAKTPVDDPAQTSLSPHRLLKT